eukprot:g11904.t1
MEKLVETYMNRGTFGQIFKANTFKDKYESIDKDIHDAIELVQLGLGSEILNQNNKLLEQTKFIMDLDEKMDEALGQLKGIGNALKKRNSMDKAKDCRYINKKTRSGGDTPLDRAYDNNNSPIKQKIIDLIRSKGGKRESE